MVLVPGGARGASLAQVRHQLSGWHLRPGPLFPSALPAGFQSTNVTLDRSSGDYVVTFARPDCSGTDFCVYYKRGPWLDSILKDPATTFVERLQMQLSISVTPAGVEAKLLSKLAERQTVARFSQDGADVILAAV